MINLMHDVMYSSRISGVITFIGFVYMLIYLINYQKIKEECHTHIKNKIWTISSFIVILIFSVFANVLQERFTLSAIYGLIAIYFFLYSEGLRNKLAFTENLERLTKSIDKE